MEHYVPEGERLAKDKLVMVEWVDSFSYKEADWISRSDLLDIDSCKCVSVGFIIYEDKKIVKIAASVIDGEGGQICGVMAIPKVAVKNITQLRRK